MLRKTGAFNDSSSSSLFQVNSSRSDGDWLLKIDCTHVEHIEVSSLLNIVPIFRNTNDFVLGSFKASVATAFLLQPFQYVSS